MECQDCKKSPTKASILCHTCGLITVTMPLDKAQLYADLYTDHMKIAEEQETHLVRVGDMTFWEKGPPATKTIWERLRLWVFGYSVGG